VSWRRWWLVAGWLVGRWLVGCHARALWPNGAFYSYYGTLIGNPTPGIQWYNFRPPGVTPNRGMGPPWGAFCQITLTSCCSNVLFHGSAVFDRYDRHLSDYRPAIASIQWPWSGLWFNASFQIFAFRMWLHSAVGLPPGRYSLGVSPGGNLELTNTDVAMSCRGYAATRRSDVQRRMLSEGIRYWSNRAGDSRQGSLRQSELVWNARSRWAQLVFLVHVSGSRSTADKFHRRTSFENGVPISILSFSLSRRLTFLPRNRSTQLYLP